ncbi:MAG: organic solvent tolerance ABC transporter substrate-binding protein [Candidatus Rokuibacteriota bacterium]|nr:MAG: organic solvent tolerance ABC transporter substrate-binding protein [Candidatus Rokubacteria bacterium]
MTGFPLIRALAWRMLDRGSEDLVMGKTLAAWIMVAGAVAAPAMGPRETVESTVGRVVTLIQDGDTVKTESATRQATDRRTELRKLARELFDFEEVTRRTLSRHWAARSADERAEFVALFTDLLERSYITRVEAYAGENITYLGEAVDASFATVRSRILTDRRSEIALDYRLHLRDGRWRVYDLQIDGVSFVSTYRSQFDRIIQAESYTALLERMRKKSFEATVAERGGKKL